ncbi:MAG: DUF2807 domain-containing protein [Flavobacterium sp.]
MKKYTILLLVILSTTISFGQKREKIKGSKIVKLEQKEIGTFENLEIEDNLEIFLIKGDKCALEIEADDNLHSAINISLNGNTLRLTAAKEVSGFKKFSVKVTYTDDLKMLVAKHESNITAITDLNLDNFTFKCFDYSKVFINVKAKSFTLMANDKSKVELNLKSEDAIIELSKNAHLKALITATQMKMDMYQKSTAVIEGDVAELKLRVDNSANFTGKNLTAKNAEIIAEANTNCSVNVTTKAIVEASGKSEIQFYGDAKIELKKFTENTVIMKKSLK